jgi:hypothetical protein
LIPAYPLFRDFSAHKSYDSIEVSFNERVNNRVLMESKIKDFVLPRGIQIQEGQNDKKPGMETATLDGINNMRKHQISKLGGIL